MQAGSFRAEPPLPWARHLVLCSSSPWHGHGDAQEDRETCMAGAVPADLIDGLL